MENFKAYGTTPLTSGLYTWSPGTTALKRKIGDLWRKALLKPLNGYQIDSPILLPKAQLARSGHLDNFGSEIYQILQVDPSLKGSQLCLRPETTQSIFADYKTLRFSLKGSPLVLGQIGKAFRREKSTRTGSLRCSEFEQAEIEIFYTKEGHKKTKEKRIYKLLDRFFTAIGIEPLKVEKVEVVDLPHYSKKTVDLYYKGWQIGCINDRGEHDLTPQGVRGVGILELSLGLTRITNLLEVENKK